MRPFLFAPAILLVSSLAFANDPGRAINSWAARATGEKLRFQFEFRQRAEDRTGQLFGRDRDLAASYLRFRIGASFRPRTWLKFSGLLQDARAAFYGAPAPGNVRDPLDLQEGYVEIFSEKQRGFGATVGRQMLGFGDTRIIGSPQWAYTARTWDNARVYHVSANARLEAVFLATIVPRGTGFNRPVLGDRIWGTYNVFKSAFGANKLAITVDAYILRHDQNRPGGFTGAGTLGINLFGTRWAATLPRNFRNTTEVIVQTGQVGPLTHRALGFVNQFGYRTTLGGLPVDFANEYKYASGTNASSGRSGTFDQLYPAAHDKMGHADFLAWKNVHNIRSITTLTVHRGWNVLMMYNNSWLASPTDGVYTLASRLITRDPAGRSGRHIGQELDLYTNLTLGGMAISGGVGQFFPGEFIQKTTPGAHSRLLYLSTGYSF